MDAAPKPAGGAGHFRCSARLQVMLYTGMPQPPTLPSFNPTVVLIGPWLQHQGVLQRTPLAL